MDMYNSYGTFKMHDSGKPDATGTTSLPSNMPSNLPTLANIPNMSMQQHSQVNIPSTSMTKGYLEQYKSQFQPRNEELEMDVTQNQTCESSMQTQIQAFEKRNFSVAGRMQQQLKAAKEFEQFYHDQKKLKELKEQLEHNEKFSKQYTMQRTYNRKTQLSETAARAKNTNNHDDRANYADSLQLLSQNKHYLHDDYDQHVQEVISRKASPPGQDGIESITALGNAHASPISNFYCRGYHPAQRYWIDKLDAKGRLLHKRQQKA